MGRKSANGMNSARFIIADTLLLVIENNNQVTITSNTSPIIGIPNREHRYNLGRLQQLILQVHKQLLM